MKSNLIPFLLAILMTPKAFAQPKAAFEISASHGCNPLVVKFTNQSAGISANAVFEWDFGNGNRSSVKNPSAIYTEEKTFSVTLTVRDNGQVSTASREITVHPAPQFDFVSDLDKICIPAAVQFSCVPDPGSGQFTSFFWEFGDGSTAETSQLQVSHAYNMELQPSVSLTVTNAHGCYSSVRKNGLLQVLPRLEANFKADDSILCRVDEPVQFRNNSKGSGTLSYEWEFGDGTTSTLREPTHVFNKKGNYTVILVTKNSAGCIATQTKTEYLNVANYKAAFTMTDTVCALTNMQFYSSSSPTPANLQWTLNDQFDYFGDGVNLQSAESGTMKVRLIAQFDNCADTVTQERTIRPRPELAGFVAEQLEFCTLPAKFEFRDTSGTAVRWAWSFNYYGDPIPEATTRVMQKEFSQGSYFVRLDITNKEGCSSSHNRWIELELPSFEVRLHTDLPGTYHTCDSARVNFEAVRRSGIPHQQIAKYFWDLGNGAMSTEISPYAFYNAPDKYHKITLNYETDKGCKGSVVAADLVYIGAGVKADFEPMPAGQVVCGSSNFSITSTSTGASLRSRWLLNGQEMGYGGGGDFWGNVDKPGSYDVTLIVNDGYFCSDTITKKAAVVAVGPFPQFTRYENSCENRGEVTFFQETIGGTSWEWDFGDGTKETFNANLPFVKHTYQAVGEYYVTLTATEGNCSITTRHKTIPVLLKQNLELAAGKTKICKDDALPVTIKGFDPNYNENYYQFVDHFEYEDGTRFKGYYNSYPLMGEYEGDLHSLEVGKKKIRAITISGGFGCYDTTNYIDYQIVGAVADFTVNRNAFCFNDSVVVRDASIKDNTEIVYWQWDFGDGTLTESTTPEPVSHSYTQPGNYTIQLKIRDESGCGNFASTSTKQVAANGPKASFETSGTTVELNSNVSFLNTTNIFGVSQAQYQWDFGDGTRSQEVSPSHTYAVAGNYTVTLTATDPVTGCRSVYNGKMEVKNFAYGFTKAASFVTAGNCPPVVVRFTNRSQNFKRIVWDFGDGQTLENVPNPSHVYEQPGKYYIRLLVYGHNGLEGSQLDSVELRAPVPAIATNVWEVCKDGAFSLTSSTTGVKAYTWDFGDGTVISGQSHQADYQYSATGTYQPRLLVTDTNGCVKAVELNGKLTVRDNPVVRIDPSTPEICAGTPVRLIATGGQSYDWQPATGLDNARIANPLASPSRTRQYTVTVKDDLGCSATSSTTVTVITKEQVTLAGGKEICQGEQLQLFASGASRYEWIGTTTGLSSTTAANPFANALQTTTYSVVGFDRKGCFGDTVSAEVIVRPLPTIDASPGGVVFAGNSFQVTTTASPDVTSYNWTSSRFLDCSQCPSPLSKPLSDITYEVEVKNQYGCKASDTLQLHLLCGATGASIPNAFSPNGDGNNERFVIMGVAQIKRLIIYDRWGSKVFDRKDLSPANYHHFWDGTYAGSPSPTGTYVYFAELECKPGETVTRKGSFLLVR